MIIYHVGKVKRYKVPLNIQKYRTYTHSCSVFVLVWEWRYILVWEFISNELSYDVRWEVRPISRLTPTLEVWNIAPHNYYDMPLCRESSLNKLRHQKSFACFRVTQILKERQNNQGEKRFAFLSFFLFRENDIRE